MGELRDSLSVIRIQHIDELIPNTLTYITNAYQHIDPIRSPTWINSKYCQTVTVLRSKRDPTNDKVLHGVLIRLERDGSVLRAVKRCRINNWGDYAATCGLVVSGMKHWILPIGDWYLK